MRTKLNWQRWVKGLQRVAVVLIGVVALVATIAWLSGMFEPKISPGRADINTRKLADQPTDIVHEITKSTVEEAIGTLKAASRTNVAAKVLATIDEITVSAGDHVDQGQLLIQLDNKEFAARVDQAKRVLQGATAKREEAESQFSRVKKLAENNAVSNSEYDQASRDVQVTQAEEARAEQAVSEAEIMFSYTSIYASKKGRIVDRLAEPGDVAQPGAPILILYDEESLRLEAPVMEQLAITLRPQDQLRVHIDALDKDYEAVVDEIVPQADAPTRSFLVKATLPKSADLYEGMFGRLRIPAGDRQHLCIASDAIVKVGQLEFVDVVTSDDSIERRLIKTGQLGMPGRQEVLSGIQAGERVILHGSADSDGGKR